MKTLYAPMGVPQVDKKTLKRCVEWWDNLKTIDPEIQELSAFVYEALVFVGLRGPCTCF